MRQKILVVGQTPPPFGGQAVMIEKMIEEIRNDIEVYHVRMGFSQGMDEIGKFSPKKVSELIKVIIQIYIARFRHSVRVLYYPPGGSNYSPILRDMVILLATRWLFETVIFHFHASGLGERYDTLPPLAQFFFRLAYFKPDIGIRLSEMAPEDAKTLEAREEYVIPNGIEDDCGPYVETRTTDGRDAATILFVGVLCQEKGVGILLEACQMLVSRDVPFRINMVGQFESRKYEASVRADVATMGLEEHVQFSGVLTGDAKRQAFIEADVFCLPTYFASETQSVVLLEALCYGLPIVTTRWRAIPSIVEDGKCGFLVPIRDAAAVSNRLERLIRNAEMRRGMGKCSRQRYLECYTLDQYVEGLRRVFERVCT